MEERRDITPDGIYTTGLPDHRDEAKPYTTHIEGHHGAPVPFPGYQGTDKVPEGHVTPAYYASPRQLVEEVELEDGDCGAVPPANLAAAKELLARERDADDVGPRVAER